MKEKITKIAEKANESKYVPNASTFFRAGVSAIPVVGGALDHLIFDKSDEIRTRNIEAAISSLEDKYKQLEQNSVNLDWFSTGEAVNLFKELISLIEYEDSQEKLEAISSLYAVSSTYKFTNENQKSWVMRKVSELSNEQRKLFKIVASMSPEQREFSSGALMSTETAIWNDTVFNDIENKFNIDPSFRFWRQGFNLDVELELLASTGLLVRHQAMFAKNAGYKVSVFGKIVLSYLKAVG
ncbi:hypothetical protein [Vibrio parahaemolyticus]|uniref:hypothetical protein n=1 Tax=Vibrio parahaemolyticus TaxID=670 RepID=UPI00084B822B|nr:hypothetical protein [Vibrio parahaemolyticus]EHH3742066.1 hypothetical protein [Vibrio parahaemolyticus]EHR1277982.1 hypothetical protein [Vibrio parahaemolyticus]EHU4841442.1 hypothetical protein [Vibrio parahaemolyticus]EHU5162174.1 hypothetical protein [Vibrio parahaemolyticus]EHU5194244.1 hypothetical protein [Vibrio parahaemolyticus]